MVIKKYQREKLSINWDIANGLHKLHKLEIRYDEENMPVLWVIAIKYLVFHIFVIFITHCGPFFLSFQWNFTILFYTYTTKLQCYYIKLTHTSCGNLSFPYQVDFVCYKNDGPIAINVMSQILQISYSNVIRITIMDREYYNIGISWQRIHVILKINRWSLKS